MAVVINQNIPAEMLDAYKRSLHQATEWKPGSDLYQVRHRVPFRLPHMQNPSFWTPSAAQRLVRDAFKKSCDCFNLQLDSGGVEPPDIGPRNKDWWYDQSLGSGLWYYNYFIQQTWGPFYADTPPDWCKIPAGPDATVISLNPNTNYGGVGNLRIEYYNPTTGEREMRAFIQRPNSDVSTLHLRMLDWNSDYRTLHYYQVTQDWGEFTITWNNQPPTGSLIGSFDTKPPDDPNPWVQLPGITSPSIAIKQLSLATGVNRNLFSSKQETPASRRPYWT